MKKMAIRRAALLLSLLTLLAPPLTACGSGENESEVTTTLEQQEHTDIPKKTDNLPDVDMDGFTMTLLNHTDSAHSFSFKTFDTEGILGDTIGDVIFERNRHIENRFGAVIKEVQVDNFIATLTNSVLASVDFYDVALCYDRRVNLVNTTGLLTTWDNLSYVNLAEEWWNSDANECFRINNKQFAAVGDFSLSMYSKSYVFFLNKTLYSTVGDLSELYDTARQGKWTLDRMLMMMEPLNSDLDGNGYGVNDQYGIEGSTKVYFQLLLTGSGIKLVDTDSTGNPYFALQNNERAVDIILDIINKHTGINTFFNYSPAKADAGIKGDEFKAGRVGLLAGTMWDYSDFEFVDFPLGILPAPKYDEAQANYCTTTVGGVVSVIPSNIPEERTDNTGILLEALSFYSRENLLPVYANDLLQARYADKQDDADMIQIIFNSQTYDLGCLVWNDEIRMPLMNNVFHTYNTNVASFIKTISPTINATIKRTIDSLN